MRRAEDLAGCGVFRAKHLLMGEEEEGEESILFAGFDPIFLTAILSISVVPR